MTYADTYNNFDVDRLHEVIEGKRVGRGQGATFATLTQMLGEVQLGDAGNVYLYIGENRQWSFDVLRQFGEMIRTHEPDLVTVHREQRQIEVVRPDGSSQTFYFLGPDGLDQFCRGRLLDRVFVDVTPNTRYNYEDQIMMAEEREMR